MIPNVLLCIKNAFTASQKVVEDIDTDTDESRKVNSKKWTAESKKWKVYDLPKNTWQWKWII